MLPWQTNLVHQLQELHLIRCSLLPGEHFAFVLSPDDVAIWSSLLDAFTDAGGCNEDDDEDDSVVGSLTHAPCQVRFEVRAVGAHLWIEVALPPCTDTLADPGSVAISVKGEHISRATHERWHSEVRARIAAVIDDETCAFPAYELVTQLTGALHQSREAVSSSPAPAPTSAGTGTGAHDDSDQWHALLTAHHLVSPSKRRTMHHLAAHLGLVGFAKVGYPGIVYAEGPRGAVEAFVGDVKKMQWFALRVCFVEAVPGPASGSGSGSGSDLAQGGGEGGVPRVRWEEVSKVGEVLGRMRARGRESLVTDLGIGTLSQRNRNPD